MCWELHETICLKQLIWSLGHMKCSRRISPHHYLSSCSVSKSCLTLSTWWTAACQASLSFTISQSLLKLRFIESVMPSNCLILCYPFLLPPSVFPSIRVFSDESALCIRWPKYWNFNFSPSDDIQGWFPLRLTGLISLQSRASSRVFSSTTVRKHQFFGTQPSLWSNSHIHTWLLQKPHSFDYRALSATRCLCFLIFFL